MEYRVFGPPGTGKTTYLSRVVEEAARRYGPDRVYALSYTRAAARELASRRLPLPRRNVGTVHSLCFHLLGQPRVAEVNSEFVAEWNRRYGTYDPRWAVEEGRDAALDDVVGVGGDEVPATEAGGMLMAWNAARSRAAGRVEPVGELRLFVEAWERAKREAAVVDFVDLLLDAPEDIGAAALIFDEAQDATPLMWRVVRRWGARARMFVAAGDDDQLIYHWLGARPEPFLAGAPGRERVLRRSYRLPRAVYEFAVGWARSRISRRRDKEFSPTGEEGCVASRPYVYEAPEALVAEVADRVAAGRRVMVLATCGYMLRPVVEAMRSAGVPYHNPYRPARGEWWMFRAGAPLRGARAFAALSRAWREWDEGVVSDAELWRFLAGVVRSESGFVRGAKARFNAAGRRVSPVEVAALVRPALSRALDEADWGWLAENAVSSARGTVSLAVRAVRRFGERALEGGFGAVVGTVHSVKGGEADDVFVFPDVSPSAARRREFSADPDERDAIARVAYVAFTRARRELHLCAPSGSLTWW